MDVRPGDIVFYPDVGTDWKRRIFVLFQKWGNEMGGISENDVSYTHVGMITTETDLMIDMKWPRPHIHLFADDMREKVIMRPQCDPVTIKRAIYWCYLNLDEHYSFIDMLLGKFGLKYSYKVCSAWIDRAFKEAGFPLTRETDKLVSPNELFSSDKLVRVT